MTYRDDFASRMDDREISDQDIAEEAQRRLYTSGYIALRSVKCECRNNTVTLSGRLPSFYLKQLAQAKVLAAPFAAALVNNIDVLGSSCALPSNSSNDAGGNR